MLHLRRTGHSGIINSGTDFKPASDTMAAEHASVANYWDGSKKPRSIAPPLAGDAAVDVAIIGAGYTGLSTAYHLKFGASRGLMKTLHGKDKVRAAHHYM